MQTLQNIAKVFDGGVWPRLASWEDEDAIAYVYKPFVISSSFQRGSCLMQGSRLLSDPVSPFPGVSIQAMSISHGLASETEPYDSTAFFVSTPSAQSFLFSGDVGPGKLQVGSHAIFL